MILQTSVRFDKFFLRVANLWGGGSFKQEMEDNSTKSLVAVLRFTKIFPLVCLKGTVVIKSILFKCVLLN